MRKIVIKRKGKYPHDKFIVYHMDEFLQIGVQIKKFDLESQAMDWANRSAKKFGVPVESLPDEWELRYGR
jgi:hypothetical protein